MYSFILDAVDDVDEYNYKKATERLIINLLKFVIKQNHETEGVAKTVKEFISLNLILYFQNFNCTIAFLSC